MVSTAILILYWLVTVGLAARVIMRRVPVGISLAWLAVIFSIPFLGAIAYLLLGEKRLGRRRRARIAASVEGVRRWQAGLARTADGQVPVELAGESLCRHAERLLGFPALGGNEVELIERVESVFDALVADIDRAERSCDLGFYIWDAKGRTADVLSALERAAARGVRCRVLADAVGSRRFLRSPEAKRLVAAGVPVVAALPTGLLRSLVARVDLRNHRKVGVIDDRVAYTGSQNLVDPRYFKRGSGVGPWVDAMVRLEGPATVALGGVFRHDWAVETGTAFEAPREPLAPGLGRTTVQVVPSGPGLVPEAIHQLLLAAIYSARSELVLTTPYFVPDEAMLTALLSAALRGVLVTLIVPARNDSILVRYASLAHFDELLAAGVRVALYRGGLLHTKSLTIDGEVGVFGSVNLDPRSLWLNFELSVFVYERAFTGRLRALQESYLRRSEHLDVARWGRRTLGRRFAANAVRLVGPLL